MQYIKKLSKDKWVGLKLRVNKEYNYRALWHNLKTYRFDEGDVMELPLGYSEFYDVSLGPVCRTGRCSFCFPKGTKVLTSDGEKDISTIKKDDLVYSMSENGNIELKKVDMTFERDYDGEIIEIETEDGTKITCTPNHKIYVEGKGYVEANKLQVGDDTIKF